MSFPKDNQHLCLVKATIWLSNTDASIKSGDEFGTQKKTKGRGEERATNGLACVPPMLPSKNWDQGTCFLFLFDEHTTVHVVLHSCLEEISFYIDKVEQEKHV